MERLGCGAAEADFLQLWDTLNKDYCFFATKTTDWTLVRKIYSGPISRIRTLSEFASLAAEALAELYDAHTHLLDAPPGARRFPPFEMYARPDRDGAGVVAVLQRSGAENAGIAHGDIVIAEGDTPLPVIVESLTPRCLSSPDEQEVSYRWNTAVAGRRGQPTTYTIRTGAVLRQVVVPPPPGSAPDPEVSHSMIGDDIGYVRFTGFNEPASVPHLDSALSALADARGLVLDVRDNGGGDTAVARPMMGRFVSKRSPYALMRRRHGADLGDAWTEYVDPRGPFTYERPVVVLVNRWSASMAEGFAMGMRSIGGASIIGTPMMGLGAAVKRLRLRNTDLAVQYSAEPVYDLAGAPRSDLHPDVVVADGDDIFSRGIETLRAML